MPLFDTNAIISVANSDGEFKLAARLWNADLRLEVGADAYLLRMREGRISEFSRGDATKWDLKISAPENDWRELLKPVPKPFFQDLMAAMTRQGFKLEGDVLAFNPYYRATCRLFELMRQAA
jgi:hypothetical protein